MNLKWILHEKLLFNLIIMWYWKSKLVASERKWWLYLIRFLKLSHTLWILNGIVYSQYASICSFWQGWTLDMTCKMLFELKNSRQETNIRWKGNLLILEYPFLRCSWKYFPVLGAMLLAFYENLAWIFQKYDNSRLRNLIFKILTWADLVQSKKTLT